jgi:ABC-type molybdate transport system substrate-binding protein
VHSLFPAFLFTVIPADPDRRKSDDKKPAISFWGVPVLAGIIGSLPIWASAAELSVYAPGGVRSAVQAVATAFEHQTGHTIKFTFGTGGGIQKQIAAGAPADVTVLPSKGSSELEKAGLVVPNSRLEVGSVGVGVGIKAGTPRSAHWKISAKRSSRQNRSPMQIRLAAGRRAHISRR